ncbi:hypothetical protein Dimus_018928 [Dionaea muscipula]
MPHFNRHFINAHKRRRIRMLSYFCGMKGLVKSGTGVAWCTKVLLNFFKALSSSICRKDRNDLTVIPRINSSFAKGKEKKRKGQCIPILQPLALLDISCTSFLSLLPA